MSTKKKRNLNHRQLRFCEEYLLDLNGTQAAIRAGYSEKRADQIAFENLRKPEILSKIQAAIDERSRRTRITSDQVLQNLKSVVEDSTQRDKHGRMVNAQAACRALELLGRHLNMFGTRRKEKEKTSVYVHAPAKPSLAEWQQMVKMSLKPSPPPLNSREEKITHHHQ